MCIVMQECRPIWNSVSIPSQHSYGIDVVWEPTPNDDDLTDRAFGSYDLEQWQIDNFRECGIEDEHKPWIKEDDNEDT